MDKWIDFATILVPATMGRLSVGDWPHYDSNPFRFELTIPLWSGEPYRNDKGKFVIHDITGDGLMDYVVSFKEGPQVDCRGNAYVGA